MILYDPKQKFSLFDYGIQIPIYDSKAVRTFAHLSAHPVLGPRKDRWHITRSSEVVNREDLMRVHAPEYVEKLYSERLEQEIVSTFELIDAQGRYYRYDPDEAVRPLSELFVAILDKVSGTVQCGRTALETGFCYYFGGGMHHAQRDFGNGFCLLNDVVVAPRKLQAEGAVRTVWVVDIDAHKGDGTAALTTGDGSIVTLSIHMARGWPLDGPEFDPDGRQHPSFIFSDIDIPMERGEDHLYLPRLEAGLGELDRRERPDLALVVGGVDPYEHDELPSTADLRLTLDQLKERDMMVYRFLQERNIPTAWLMAGGYGQRAWEAYRQFLEWVLMERSGT